jgi:Cu/Ag efflux protein CusF
VRLELRVWRERIWIVGPAVVFFLANFGFFLGSRAVDASREEGLKKDLAAARARFAASEEGVRKAGTEQSHIENVRKAAEEFYGNQIGTVDETMSRTVAEIHQVCRKSGVQAHQITYSAKPMARVPLIEMTVTFAVDGDYATLRRLLFGFEQDPRWLVVRQVQLARKGETVGEGNIHLEVATYFYQSGEDPTAAFKTVNLK